jgi:hypothetical protein
LSEEISSASITANVPRPYAGGPFEAPPVYTLKRLFEDTNVFKQRQMKIIFCQAGHKLALRYTSIPNYASPMLGVVDSI